MKKISIYVIILVLAAAMMGCAEVATAEQSQGTAEQAAAVLPEDDGQNEVVSDEASASSEPDEASDDINVYGENLTVAEMMVYAIEDEYLARQTYENVLNEYGDITPFSNIIHAEEYHIEWLTALFNTYGYTVPKDESASLAETPRSFEDALAAGVTAEAHNIAMYDEFLAYDTLPDDVRTVFEDLQSASETHLAAFSRNGGGGGQGKGNGYGRNQNK